MVGLTEILYAVSFHAGSRYESANVDVREQFRHPFRMHIDSGIHRYSPRKAVRETVFMGMSIYKAAFNPRRNPVKYESN